MHEPEDPEASDDAWSIKDLGISFFLFLVGLMVIAAAILVHLNGNGWILSCAFYLTGPLLLLIGLNGVVQSLRAGLGAFRDEPDDDDDENGKD